MTPVINSPSLASKISFAVFLGTQPSRPEDMSPDTDLKKADAPTQPEPAWLSLLNENMGESVLILDDRKRDLNYIIGTMVQEYLVIL